MKKRTAKEPALATTHRHASEERLLADAITILARAEVCAAHAPDQKIARVHLREVAVAWDAFFAAAGLGDRWAAVCLSWEHWRVPDVVREVVLARARR